MIKKAFIFYKQCINNNTFHRNKKLISINEVHIRKIVLSKKDLYGKKGSFGYFIWYINETDTFAVLLCINLSQMNGYVKYLIAILSIWIFQFMIKNC